jgi:hypothetical protein
MEASMKCLSILTCVLFTVLPQNAQTAEAPVYEKLPVKEVTVFKDGHAYVLHEGTMKTDAHGSVLLDQLPAPIMGAFWAYSIDSRASLNSVIASRDDVEVRHTAITIEDMLKANVGKNLIVKETVRNETYHAMLIRILEQEATPGQPQSASARPSPNEKLALLKTIEGIRVVPIPQIQSITFLDNPQDTVLRKELKSTMTLKLDWKGLPPASEAAVGMAYVQRGLRWVPAYRVEIDGRGIAVVKLQGTLINELADMEDVTVHLVIGVPTFAFKDTPDPISFQEAVAQLSGQFLSNSSTAYSFSNAIMSQSCGYLGERRAMPVPNDSQADPGPELKGAEQSEDLFVFTVNHVTLKKGQRMVLPIAEYTLGYEDVYAVNIAMAPPLEMRRNFNSQQQLELAKLLHKPNAMHKLRLHNTSKYPLTTAPATILKDGRLLAQGMMTYTAIGNKGDLELTTAVNIGVKKSDEQTNAIPNAVSWAGNSYSKIEMKGSIELTNFTNKPVQIQVYRNILGQMVEADSEGTVKQLGNGYDGFVFDQGMPFWWNWCSWPWWWYHFNTLGLAEWTVDLEPGQTRTLIYKWHYFWG